MNRAIARSLSPTVATLEAACHAGLGRTSSRFDGARAVPAQVGCGSHASLRDVAPPRSPLAVSRCSCWESPRRESHRRDEPVSPSRCRRRRPCRRRSFRTPSRPGRSFGCPHRDMLAAWAALPRPASRATMAAPRPAATLCRTARRFRELASRLTRPRGPRGVPRGRDGGRCSGPRISGVGSGRGGALGGESPHRGSGTGLAPIVGPEAIRAPARENLTPTLRRSPVFRPPPASRCHPLPAARRARVARSARADA